jgi:hypothetical protein
MFYPDRISLHLLPLQRTSTPLFHLTFSISLPVFVAAALHTLTRVGLGTDIERRDHFDLCVTGSHISMQIRQQTSSTTIESRKFRIPSDLRRQPGYRPVSSKVGDHLRILLGVVVQQLFALACGVMSSEVKPWLPPSICRNTKSAADRRTSALCSEPSSVPAA